MAHGPRLVLLKRVKSPMLMVLESQAFVLELSVANHSHTLVEPDTSAGWLKMPCVFPALTQIQITMATDTGGMTMALMRNSFLFEMCQDRPRATAS